MSLPDTDSLVDLLRARAADAAATGGYLFLDDGEVEGERASFADLDRRARAIAVRLGEVAAAGDRALLLFPPGLDFVAAFFGCLYARVVAVPAYPPRPGRGMGRLASIVASAAPRAVLTTPELIGRSRGAAAEEAGLGGAAWIAVTDPARDGAGLEDEAALAGRWRPAAIAPETLAFLQYTSGSTAEPKGVAVTHGNLLHNQRMIREAFGQSAESTIVGWLPLYHDMGLIGNVLQPLFVGARCVLMSPLAFLQRPEVWLRAIDRYRGTTSGGPNFAYDLCVRRIGAEARRTLDLSSWTVAFNGAEPVRAETLDRFAAAFGPSGFRRTAFFPCYGLAEATLFATGGEPGAGPIARAFDAARLERGEAHRAAGGTEGCPVRNLVGCGRPRPGAGLAIVDPDRREPVAEGRIGEIWLLGGSIGGGYWRLPEESEKTFNARLAGDPTAGPFLRTGDLGFLDGGELFVSGRLKELIILRGRNHFPQDLEATAERSHPALRPGCGAAFSVAAEGGIEGEHRLVVAFEIDRRREAEGADAASAIRRAIAEEHEVAVREVVVLRQGGVPKTTSGKIQRLACCAAYLAGGLPVIHSDRLERFGPDDDPAPSSRDALDRAALAELPSAERVAAVVETLAIEAAERLQLPAASLDRQAPLTGLGLDSLAAVEIAGEVTALWGVELDIARLLGGASLESLAEEVALRLGEAEQAGPATDAPADESETGGGDLGADSPLSPGQLGLWLSLRRAGAEGAGLYQIFGAARAAAGLDAAALGRAAAALARRHPALRTVFFERDGEPRQRTLPELAPEIAIHDGAVEGSDLRRRLEAEALRPFDLARGPLWRIVLFARTGGTEEAPALLLAIHHLVADLASLAILTSELGALYAQELGGEPARLGPPGPSPGRLAARAVRRRSERERRAAFWLAEIDGAPSVLELPTDRPRRGGIDAAVVRSLAPAALGLGIAALARSRGATPFAVLLAVFQEQLRRLSGQEDLLVGAPAAGRRTPDLAGAVGYFVEVVPLRARFAGGDRFVDHLARTRDRLAAALANGEFSLPQLIERLRIAREPGRAPLVQVLCALQRTSRGGEALAAFSLGDSQARLDLGGLTLSPLPLRRRASDLDLSLFAAETGTGTLALAIEFRTGPFDATTAQRLLGQLQVLLGAAIETPEAALSDLPLLTPGERAALLSEWNDTRRPAPHDAAPGTLWDLFAAQAGRTPDRTAVIAGDVYLTYAKLERRAGAVASHLAALGIGPERRVGIFLDRSAELIAALLGALASGAAYVPLDPAYPAARVAAILEDAGVAAVLTREGLAGRLPEAALGLPVLSVELISAGGPPATVGAESGHLAYLIYTSGSTGRPKGVAIEHRSAVALLAWAREEFADDELDRVLFATSINFDLSVFEIFAPLAVGGAVVLAENALALPGVAAEVSLVNTVPSAMAELVRGGLPATVRTVALAGEPLPRALADALYSLPGVCRVLDLYGPSEDTTYSTGARVAHAREWGGDRAPSIGRPLPGTRAFGLDALGCIAPIGVPAELYLGGAGLARGYHGQPAATAERFVPDPFGGNPGARLYRTGDSVRRLPDGNLDFIGRLDHQIKLRGFRIELGEIERALASHEGVAEAAVAKVEDSATGATLVAFVVPRGASEEAAPEPRELRAFLSARLPEPMVPARFVTLSALPLSPNGKIDRRALGSLGQTTAEFPEGGDFAPRTAGERRLTELFAELLGRTSVGARDDFFDLGGHSLLASRLAARLRGEYGIEMPLARLFEHPTVESLAEWLDRERRAAPAGPTPLPRGPGAEAPLAEAQRRLWFLWRLDPGAAAYNVTEALRLEGALVHPAFCAALGEIVRRHEVLRTTYVEREREPAQIVGAPRAVRVAEIDLQALPANRLPNAADRISRTFGEAPFDLARGPVLRAALVRLAAEERRALFSLHHIACDGWSLGLLAAELGTLYGAFASGRPSPLAELPIQVADFAHWQRSDPARARREADLAYWRAALTGIPRWLVLPADRPRRSGGFPRAGLLSVLWPAERTVSLRRLGRAEGGTLFMALLGAFEAHLSRQAGTLRFAVGAPIAGRSRIETESLIGCFVNTLALPADLSGEPGLAILAARARTVVLAAESHGELPFERLVEELQPERGAGSPGEPPLVQVALAFQNVPGAPPELAGLRVTRLPGWPGAAKLDLSVSAREEGERLALDFEYDAERFDAVRLERFLGQFERLVDSGLAEPERPFGRIALLSPAEAAQLAAWGRAPVPARRPGVLAELLARASERPAAPAIRGPGGVLSYAELVARAAAAARALEGAGVEAESRVALLAPRSVDFVVGAVAAWLAGAAYVPLDPAYPAERLAFLLADCGAAALLVTRETAGSVTFAGPLVRLDDLAAAAGAVRSAPPNPPPDDAARVAYVIYTSGSTGRPKGVVVAHGALANLVAWHRHAYALGPGDRCPLLAALGFDASVWELWPVLAAGACLLLPTEEERSEPERAIRFLAAERATVAFLPTPLAEACLAEEWPESIALRLLLTGGDRLRRGPRAGLPFALINHYGPTECAVVATAGAVAPGEANPAIGRPIAGVSVLLLGPAGEPVPAGVTGEIYLGGDGLARGYLGRPERTAESFLPDPRGAEAGARLYRTGDLARWRFDGGLEFFGRADSQVKVRGFRIELGEVEAALLAVPGVREAAAAVQGDGASARIVAFVVASVGRGEGLIDAAARRLAARLPAHLVPATIVSVPALPMTPNGKLDRLALPRVEATADPTRTDGGARPEIEALIAGIFAEVLGVPSIGRGDDFFALGGHSLAAAQVAARLRRSAGIELPLADLFASPTPAALAPRVERSLAAEPEPADVAPIPRLGAAAERPLSFAQERLWFLARLEPESAAYNVGIEVELAGPLEAAALAGALAEVANRHEPLRSSFVARDGAPELVVTPSGSGPVLARIDLTGIGGAGIAGHEAERLAAAAARRPFDLARPPLARALLIRIGEGRHRLVLVFHHIVCDGWSMGVLVREAAALYARRSDLPPPPIAYSDYAAWQRGYLAAGALDRQLEFWRAALQGAPTLIDLPTDRPRARLGDRSVPPGAVARFHADAALGAAVAALARRSGATPFLVLLAAFSALLGRWSRSADLLVGTPVAGRRHLETEGLIGLFVNTLAVRADLSGPTFADLLVGIRGTVLAALARQDLPFERLVEEIRPERSLDRPPLVQVLFALQNAPLAPLALPGLESRVRDLDSGATKLDLSFSLTAPEGWNRADSEIAGRLTYRSDLFLAATVDRLLGHFGYLLAAAVAEPERPLGDLPLLGAEERTQLARLSGGLEARRVPAPSFPELFARAAAAHPERTALVAYEGTGSDSPIEIDYAALGARVDRLSRRLIGLGVGPEVAVGLLAERSAAAIVGLLAILSAGGAAVPLDADWPADRLRVALEDVGARFALTTGALLDRLPPGPRPLLLADPGDEPSTAGSRCDPIRPRCIPPESLAYVIFTSGSTGRPKGVAVEHRQLAAYVRDVVPRCGLDLCTSFASVSTLAADLGHTMVFPALASGGTLHLISREVATDAAAFGGYLARHRVDALKIVPSHLASLRGAQGAWPLPRRRLILGGEASSRAEVERLAATSECRIHNHYGPTETTVGVLTYAVAGSGASEAFEGTLPLGRPLAGAEVRVVEPAGAEAPLGVAGELWIGGEGVARGYVGRPDLSAERFVPDPFGERPGARLYRSGDLVRFLPSGDLEFLGRIDRQVKIRGFRIELGEIAAALADHPAVSQAVVVARRRPGAAEETRLAAYLVARSNVPPAAAELREYLRGRLPEAMIPGAYVALDAIPVTANGKLDEAALPEPTVEARTFAPPETPTEEMLAGLWSSLLGLERVGADDDFFLLGGHSLLATRLASRVGGAFGVEVPLALLFEAPTLAAQAARLDERIRNHRPLPAAPPLRRGARPAELPLSFAQERIWFLDQLEPGRATYNLPYFARVRGPLDRSALGAALAETVRRHEALRTRLVANGGRPRQAIDDGSNFALPTVDLAGLSVPVREREAARSARDAARRPFDLAADLPIRALLVDLGGDTAFLLLTLHHAASDGWSRGVLAGELATLYPAALAGRPSPLPEPPLQYADFALWQRGWLAGETLAKLEDAARAELLGAPPLDLPRDRAAGEGRGGATPVALPATTSAALSGLARGVGATPFMALLAAFAALLCRWTDAEDLVLGAPVANRNRRALEGLIGCFVNTLAIRLRPEPETRFVELVGAARVASLNAYAREDLPFEKLVEALAPERAPDAAPPVAAALIWQSAPMPRLAFSGLDFEPVEVHTGTAKFDLSLAVTATVGTYAGLLEYDAGRWEAATAERFLGHFRELLAGAVAAPDTPIAELPLLTPAELAEISHASAGHPLDVDRTTLVALFAAQAAATPDEEALIDGGRRFTYREIARRSEGWAGKLADLGVGPEVRVGVFLERTAEMIVALLAILRAGGAYVPLDPAYPEARTALLAEDAGVARVITDATLGRRLPAAVAGLALDLAVLDAEPESTGSAPRAAPLPENLAYLIYTSGSTGRPKAVAITHESAAARIAWARKEFAPEELRAVVASTSLAFDLSVFEIFVPLATGGKVILASTALDYPGLAAAGEATLLNTVPSALAELLRAAPLPPALASVNLAGEPLPRSLVEAAFGSGTIRRVRNLYGPSEDTTYSIGASVARGGAGPPSIGRPLDGTTARVLDRSGRARPIGVAGELALGGVGLARGYLGRPELTAERFVPDPFSERPGARLYRTGDRVRLSPDGELHFLGRLDHQVKVRGFRIELGEVEAALDALPAVAEAAALVREDRPGDRRLVAYLALAEPTDGTDFDPKPLRAALASSLPASMIPAVFVRLAALPRTPNGKVDRKALAAMSPPAAAAAGASRATLLGPTEAVLAAIWSDVLGVAEIGPDDSFFALGGHSLLAARAAARGREAFGVDLPLRELFEAPTLGALAERYEIARRAGEEGPAPLDASAADLDPGAARGPLPASLGQRRLWLLDRLAPGGAAYNLTEGYEIEGPLDPAAFAAALGGVARRHQTLRTSFLEIDGEPMQRVAAAQAVSGPVPGIDLAGRIDPDRRAVEAGRLADAAARRGFDLASGPLVRALLIRLDAGAEGGLPRHLAIVALHHTVADGVSLGVLIREIAAHYSAARQRRPAGLPPLPIQYADWAVWQRRSLAPILDRRLAWWRQALAGMPTDPELPTDRPKRADARRGGRTAARGFALEPDRVAALERFARARSATPFLVLLAGFAATLARTAGRADLVLGTPVAGRRHVETEGLIGFFVETVALPLRLDPAASFAQMLAVVRSSTLDAFAHGDLPFDRLAEALGKGGERADRSPIAPVAFALQHAPAPLPDLPGLSIVRRPLASGDAKFDLALLLVLQEGRIAGRADYDPALYDPATIDRLLGRFDRLLGAALDGASGPWAELPLLGAAERHQLSVEWNDTATPFPSRGLAFLFFERAAERPDAVAIDFSAEQLSYGALADRARRIAAALSRRGVRPGSRIGLGFERSAALVEAMLGTLAAGAAYVPLDPTYPAERLAFMAEDAELALVLSDPRLAASVPRGVPSAGLAELLAAMENSGAPPNIEPPPEALAYVVYTSGSTGRPKGIAVPQKAVCRLVLNTDYLPFGPNERIGFASNVSFDAATFEIWGALLHGARLLGLSRAVALEPRALAAALAEREVTSLFLTTALFQQVVREAPDAFAGLSHLLFGGETADPARVREALARPPRRLLHVYGPTESTTFATWGRVTEVPKAATTVPIGRPLANGRLAVAERWGAAAPIGTPGELLLGGDGLAHGYLGRPELSAERFVPDPEGPPGSRLYRTGDKVRRRPDGAIDFLGRFDGQVKLRGFRIELAEIEAALVALPGVAAAAVALREDRPGDRRLAAYVVPAAGAPLADPGVLRRRLAERLPDVMLPTAWICLDRLPLNPNGKVDRAALPAPTEAAAERSARRAATTQVEQVVAAIWGELLGREDLGPDDDFFALGGHSLLAARAAARLRDLLGVELPLADLFDHPTLASLAERIEDARSIGGSPTAPVRRAPGAEGSARWPLSFAQERLYFLAQLEPESAAYNVAQAVEIEGPFVPMAFAAALGRLIARHEALRTRYALADGVPVQEIVAPEAFRLPEIDLRALPAKSLECAARAIADAEARRPFDLGRPPLVRAAFARLAPERLHLLLALHHVATDGWSMGVFVEELDVLYARYAAEEMQGVDGPAALPPLALRYVDWAVWQRDRARLGAFASDLAYWRRRLAGAPALDLPADRPRQAERSGRGGSCGLVLPAPLSSALGALARSQGATSFMLLLAGFELLLGRLAGREDVAVGSPVAGRTRREVEGLIGFFVNLVVLRADLSGAPSGLALLARVREATLEALAHQELPFDRLVQELRPERTLVHTPLFQILFAFQTAGGAPPSPPGLKLTPLVGAGGGAKFDLTLALGSRTEGFHGRAEYAADLFDRPTIERFLRTYASLLAGLAADPELPVSALPLLSAAERHQVEIEGNDTALAADDLRRSARSEATIHSLFGSAALAAPEGTALVFEGHALSYGELARRAGALAARLRVLGVGPEVLVAVVLERSVELVAALLAVLEAGGAYVPIDPSYPEERVAFMIEDARAGVLITRSDLARALPPGPLARRLMVDDPAAWTAPPDAAAARRASPDQLAYAIYTSGSTGRPKAAGNAHRGVVNRLLWMIEEQGIGRGDRFLQKTPFSFDVSAWELFCPLAAGGTLVIALPGGHRDPVYLARRAAEEAITTLHFAPSLLGAFLDVWQPERTPALARVVASGEALPPELAARFAARAASLPVAPVLYNLYGPTEAAIEVSAWSCAPEAHGAAPRIVPIGRPITDVLLYVLDAELQPAPIGIPGELWIAGVAVGRGYLGRPDLTAERFVPDPFGSGGGSEGGARMYRTGDLARVVPGGAMGGAIDFLGRLDHQVKVRGLRIELGEIEAALGRHCGVREAVIVARSEAGGEPRLIAYFVATGHPAPSVAELRDALKLRLPDYMIPSLFVPLAALPLTSSGKVDRRSLPDPEAGGRADLGTEFVAPRNAIEERLAKLWAEVLRIERVGVFDNFFALGGDSILSLRLVARAAEAAEIPASLSPRHLFQYQTIAELAAALSREGDAAPEAIESSQSGELTSDAVSPMFAELAATDLEGLFEEVEFEERTD